MDPQATPAPAPQSAPVAAPAPAAAPTPLTEWPGAFGLYKFSKPAVRLNLGTIVGVYLINIVINIILRSIFGQDSFITGILELLIGTFISAALYGAILMGVRGTKTDFSAAAKLASSRYLNYLLTTILFGIIVVVGTILLIVPGIIALGRLSSSLYFVLDQNLGPVDALKASWEATRGHQGKFWGIFGATIAMALLVITIIGIPFAIYFLVMYSAAFALYYDYVRTHPGSAAVPGVTSAPTAQPTV